MSSNTIADELGTFLREYMIPRIRRLGGVISGRDVRRHVWRFRECGDSVLASMVGRGFGRWETKPSGPKGGRPSRMFVLADEWMKAPSSEPAREETHATQLQKGLT